MGRKMRRFSSPVLLFEGGALYVVIIGKILFLKILLLPLAQQLFKLCGREIRKIRFAVVRRKQFIQICFRHNPSPYFLLLRYRYMVVPSASVPMEYFFRYGVSFSINFLKELQPKFLGMKSEYFCFISEEIWA